MYLIVGAGAEKSTNPTYLLTYSMVQDIIWKADWHSACQKKSRFLMESEGSLSCSQKSTIGPYPQPHQSSPYLHTLLPEHPFPFYRTI